MARAVTSKTESLTLRVPIAVLAAWKAMATARGLSLAALILERMASDRQTQINALRSDPANRIIDPKVSHVSGPVLADAVPRSVTGDVGWCGLKDKTGKGNS